MFEIILLSTLFYCAFAQPFDSHITVTLENGSPLRGIQKHFPSLGEDVGYKAFFGIQYATAQRWKRPILKEPFTETRDCTSWHQPVCLQTRKDEDLKTGHAGIDTQGKRAEGDECLLLNVFAPVTAQSGSNLPVFIYIPGGAGQYGGAFALGYDGRLRAMLNNMIVVVMNYRVNIMGYWGIRGLVDEQGTGTTGNFGLLDQREAMRWVNINIASFGGNPSKVFVQGTSHGSKAASWHFLSPGSWPYFRGMGMFSGSLGLHSLIHDTPQQGHSRARNISRILGCEEDHWSDEQVIQCMRALPTSAFEELMDQHNRSDYFAYPVVDGVELLDWPANLWKEGRFAQKPVIMGVMENDTSFMWQHPALVGLALPKTDEEWYATLVDFFPNSDPAKVRTLAESYPLTEWPVFTETPGIGDLPSLRRAIGMATHKNKDYHLACSLRWQCEQVVKHGGTCYLTVWRHQPPSWQPPLQDYELEWTGVEHLASDQVMFGNPYNYTLSVIQSRPFVEHPTWYQTPVNTYVLQVMSNQYWRNMAEFGTPNNALTPNLPTWNPLTLIANNHMQFFAAPTALQCGVMESQYRGNRCGVIDELVEVESAAVWEFWEGGSSTTTTATTTTMSTALSTAAATTTTTMSAQEDTTSNVGISPQSQHPSGTSDSKTAPFERSEPENITSSELSFGLIGAIVMGALFLVLIVLLLGALFVRASRKRNVNVGVTRSRASQTSMRSRGTSASHGSRRYKTFGTRPVSAVV